MTTRRRKTTDSVFGHDYISSPLVGLYSERGYNIQSGWVLLDPNMPNTDSWEVYRRIRELNGIPVLIVTLDDQKSKQQKGITPSADNGITKRVNFPELLAQIPPVLRRNDHGTQGNSPGTFREGELEVEWRSHQVWVRGQRVKLSLTEFRILACLIKNRGWIVTHEQLLKKVWGLKHIGNKSFVKVYVSYLRKKIEKDPSNPQLILTERGVGYCFYVQREQSLGERLDQMTRRGFPTNREKPDKSRNLVKSVPVT